MATNPPKSDNHRNGAVRDRSQVKNDKIGRRIKRDRSNGMFISQKDDGKPYKGVTREK